MLYIIGTPIGNLGDITERALSTLKSVDIIYAEDTRTALGLLNHFGISKTVRSYHKDNETKGTNDIAAIIAEGKTVALISEAGMPCISDPGTTVVKYFITNNLPLTVVPGATAFTHALVSSGFCGGSFYFHGFLPSKNSDKQKELEKIRHIPSVLVFYESPHRVKETIELLINTFHSTVAVCRELTKKFEETVFINNIDEINSLTIKGEFCLLVDNSGYQKTTDGLAIQPDEFAKNLAKAGFTSRDILEILKSAGVKRNIAYELSQQNNSN